MRKAWNHNDWIIWAAGIGLTLFCYVLGLNHASGAGGKQPPPCPNKCDCKVVSYWQPPGMPMYGSYVKDDPRTTFPTAILNINPGKGSCQNNPLVPNGNSIRWQIVVGTLSCTPPPMNINITEVDGQLGVIPNTDEAMNANNCTP